MCACGGPGRPKKVIGASRLLSYAESISLALCTSCYLSGIGLSTVHLLLLITEPRGVLVAWGQPWAARREVTQSASVRKQLRQWVVACACVVHLRRTFLYFPPRVWPRIAHHTSVTVTQG